MQRKCRNEPLANQPLVLVLAQVKFSPIRQIDQYIPAIQEAFRRGGYPLERSGKLQQVVLSAQGALHATEQSRWEYRTRDETTSVLVLPDSVVLQTTAYAGFEKFAERLERVVDVVLKTTENDEFGVVQRVGLRYINLIRPRAGESHRDYLQAGFHGVADSIFEPDTHRVHVQSVGKTKLDNETGTLIVRVSQSEGQPLPADLLVSAPQHSLSVDPKEVTTLLDIDHFAAGNFDPDAQWITSIAYLLHDQLIEAFHEHVVTPRAIEVWK